MNSERSGNAWFAKAVDRGAKPEAVDAELRAIFRRAKGAEKEQLRRHLIEIDPHRYSWANPPEAARQRQGPIGAATLTQE